MAPVGDILIVAGWERMSGQPWRVVVPDDADPTTFDFSFVAGLPCRLFARTLGRMDEVAAAVARFDPRILAGCARDTKSTARFVIYVRDPRIGTWGRT
jgi:hypothetical protein